MLQQLVYQDVAENWEGAEENLREPESVSQACATRHLRKETHRPNSRAVGSLCTRSLNKPGALGSQALADEKQLVRSRPKLIAGVETPTEGGSDSSRPGGGEHRATDASAQNPQTCGTISQAALTPVWHQLTDEESEESGNASFDPRVSVLPERTGDLRQFSFSSYSSQPAEQPQVDLQSDWPIPPRRSPGTAFPTQASLPFTLTRLLLVTSQTHFGNRLGKAAPCQWVWRWGRLPEPAVPSIVTFFAGVYLG